MTLLELAERCQAATRPDRALDQAIFDVLNPPKPTEDVELPEGWGEGLPHNFGSWTPNYTAFVTDACAIIPEGYDWAAGHEDGASFGIAYPPGKLMPMIEAASPSLALCAAALRARAAVGDA